MPECPVEPSVPHRIRLNVRISPKYSEYQIFGQKCAEYQISGKTPYILNFPAHTKIYLSSQRKQILIAVEATTLPTAVHCVLKIQHYIQIILCVKDVMACNMRCYWACQCCTYQVGHNVGPRRSYICYICYINTKNRSQCGSSSLSEPDIWQTRPNV